MEPSAQLEGGNAVLETVLASEGGRALRLLKQRQKRQREIDESKKDIETKGVKVKKIDEKYDKSQNDALEETFKEKTTGLLTVEMFREKRLELEKNQQLEEDRLAAQASSPKLLHSAKSAIKETVKRTRKQLSFVEDSDGGLSDSDNPSTSSLRKYISSASGTLRDCDYQPTEASIVSGSRQKDSEMAEPLKKEASKIETTSRQRNEETQENVHFRRLGKDPTVNTAFLPDRERDERLKEEQRLRCLEQLAAREREKRELFEVVYSYWDGSGHRRTATVEKGSTVGAFLAQCQADLEKQFPLLRTISPDALMFVKEDVILPHHVTFYELIQSGATGRTGPLFRFDATVHIGVTDCRRQKDSHAGKVVTKRWYEKNRHIFPATKWELYAPPLQSERDAI